jgi:hypothetical protein
MPELLVELGFEGGGVLRCSATAEAFDELVRAFLEQERLPMELSVDGKRAVVDLSRAVYVRELRDARPISFAER